MTNKNQRLQSAVTSTQNFDTNIETTHDLTTPNNFLRASISNGHPQEQAMIRRWWHESHGARGRLVWEYYLPHAWPDAVWFADEECVGIEESGRRASILYPLRDANIVLCEAKMKLTPELIGQALVYSWAFKRAGAHVREIVIFAESDPRAIRGAAESLGLTVVLP